MPVIRAVPGSPDALPVGSTVFPPMMEAADSFTKDKIVTWFRGEFAAANAIIDVLCSHLTQLGGCDVGSEYENVFAALHRRRMNWIPILQMQKYHSIADVTVKLKKLTKKKVKREEEEVFEVEKSGFSVNGGDEGGMFAGEDKDSPDSDITDLGSQGALPVNEIVSICSNHEGCNARTSQIKLTKGFKAKERVKGHTVNVVKGLKLYEDVFTDSELCKLTDFVDELRVAGQKGELSGETYVLFNKQMKGNRKELVQFGIPIFGHIKEEASSNKQSIDLEPIPALLEGVIDHLIQWQLIPEYRRPNGCIIHFFDEDEYSQPFLKPPHLEHHISTLVLSASTMAFGGILMTDSDGNFKGPVMLSLKEGSLLVMRGNSADLARHVMCPSPNKRACITFFRVRTDSHKGQSLPRSPMAGVMTLWQHSIPSPYPLNGILNDYEPTEMMPKWGVLRTPMLMLTPIPPMVLNSKRMLHGGTGVFLPWTVGSRKPTKHLPPRMQKTRLLALPPSLGAELEASKQKR